MKRQKNSSTDKRDKKVLEEFNGSWFNESINELLESIEEDKKENDNLKNELWKELNKGNSLNKIQGKIKAGSLPNDLECLLIGMIRI